MLHNDNGRRLEQEPLPTALNAIKLELALAVMICIVATLLTIGLTLSPFTELMVLALVGTVCAIWVVLRTRQVVRRLGAAAAGERHDGAQQEQ